jgi:predicted Zn-dependent peptidase
VARSEDGFASVDLSSRDKADIPDLIEELDDLRQRGILSQEEFEAKKKELLARI